MVKNLSDRPAVQIFIACLIPNLGSWVVFLVLLGKFDQDEETVKSFLDPPPWVSEIHHKTAVQIFNFMTQVVPVAWITLYTSSGFASWRVWKVGEFRAKIPLLLYSIKLLLNWLWPLIAFGLGSLLGAIIDTILLQTFVVLTGIAFYRIDKISGLIFIPYFMYLCYVFVLCTHIYILNN